MSTPNIEQNTVVLTARIRINGEALLPNYRATLESLALEGEGATLSEAQDDLVQKLSAWIQENDGRGELEQALSEAGYNGVGEDTEVQLEFAEG